MPAIDSQVNVEAASENTVALATASRQRKPATGPQEHHHEEEAMPRQGGLASIKAAFLWKCRGVEPLCQGV